MSLISNNNIHNDFISYANQLSREGYIDYFDVYEEVKIKPNLGLSISYNRTPHPVNVRIWTGILELNIEDEYEGTLTTIQLPNDSSKYSCNTSTLTISIEKEKYYETIYFNSKKEFYSMIVILNKDLNSNYSPLNELLKQYTSDYNVYYRKNIRGLNEYKCLAGVKITSYTASGRLDEEEYYHDISFRNINNIDSHIDIHMVKQNSMRSHFINKDQVKNILTHKDESNRSILIDNGMSGLTVLAFDNQDDYFNAIYILNKLSNF